MLVLGFAGGYDLINDSQYVTGRDFFHDAAAVLIEDGNVLFAIEEERLNRIKHTNKLPVQSIKACLASRNLQFSDIDMFAYYEEKAALWLRDSFIDLHEPPIMDTAKLLQQRFRHGFGVEVEAEKFRFVTHHFAHAMSALMFSGFEDSLVVTYDAEGGEDCSGVILNVAGGDCKELASLRRRQSLGYFYDDVIVALGYGGFDEYKVMGLAPYGDPRRLRDLFRTFYTLLPDGQHKIEHEIIEAWLGSFTPRRKGEPFTQDHKDIAAALQESLEELAFHIITHYQRVTRQKNLCLGGGVGHNCTLNGKLLRSGLFENIFVQPAAHDAGCALGAALFTYHQMKPGANRASQLQHVYWGTDIGAEDAIRQDLDRWLGLLEFDREDDIVGKTADLLAHDKVIGWVQGRSEFGPRALGNRSILADPRPAKNKDHINQLVKKREGYRPFAPSVIEEEAETFFDIRSEREEMGFMIFVVEVRKEKRATLGAVTHVDGTARVQTVSRKTNERFWRLIKAFGDKTGVPILLNTSFNNNVEPIVDSTEDSIVCFLTTGLDYLAIGDFLVKKKEITWSNYLSLTVALPPHISLHHVKKVDDNGGLTDCFFLGVSDDEKVRYQISPDIAQVLSCANTKRSLAAILGELRMSEAEIARSVVNKLLELWSRRLIILTP